MHAKTARLLLLALILSLLVSHPVSAKFRTWEQVYGATNINAATGNGGLTAALSRRGELTVLRWPGPSYYEHLTYITLNTDDARELPYFGALPSMGAFFGLVVLEGDQMRVTWLRDPQWTIEQRYLSPRCDVIVNDYRHEYLGLTVRTTAFVSAQEEALLWQIELEAQERDDVTVLRGLFYENLTPSTIQIPYVPVGGWALDIFADYVALFDEISNSVLHALPEGGSLEDLSPLMRKASLTRSDVRAFLDGELLFQAPGIYLGATLLNKPFDFQIGEDDADNCGLVETVLQNADWDMLGLPDLVGQVPVCAFDPMPEAASSLGWAHRPQSAWEDTMDGTLSGSPAAGVQTSGVLSFELSQTSGATVVIAAADTLAELRATLARLRTNSLDQHLKANMDFWLRWTTGALVPETDDERILRFAIRALISLKTAQDRSTGNIVASVANQPTYAYDWPRDSAFLNYALDLAGFTQEVTLHNRTYTGYQRTEPLPFNLAPAGTYETNYDAAGRPGGPILFEIDNTGLITWSYYDHYCWLAEKRDSDALAYLLDVYPAIALAADELAACRDEATGLQCAASEDDNLEKTQTIQGAAAVYAALVAAAEAGEAVGEDPVHVGQWRERADELRASAIEYFWDDDEGRFTGSYKGERWTIFPTGLLSPGDPMAERQVSYLLDQAWDELAGDQEVLHYTALSFVSLAWYFRETDDAAGLAEMREIVREFLYWIPTPDTLHLGEWSVIIDEDGDGFGEAVVNEVCLPHVWNQALNYMAAVFAFGGTPLPADDEDEDDEEDDDEGGCGC